MCNDAQTPKMIGLDWGTSSLRAYLLGRAGQILSENSLPLGIMPLRKSSRTSDVNRTFEEALMKAIGAWIEVFPGPLPIVAAGMIGSAQGWKEIPYLEIPFDVRELGLHLAGVRVSSGAVMNIVPGLLRTRGLPNVMRGEETQVLGTVSTEDNEDVLIGLPGTHSKWCLLQGGEIKDFETFITGELYQAVRQHTIIGQSITREVDDISLAFDRGVEVATGTNGILGGLSTIFSVRSLNLVGQLLFEEQADYLSGLLIGHEIQAVLRWIELMGLNPERPPEIRLVGRPSLCARYRRALASCGVANAVTIPNASAMGLWQIAIQANLLPALDDAALRKGPNRCC